ncbi:MAG: AAA family ATPase [Anaerolineae bacterium]|nr:AAA family ATPase [Anaerolineae bacterium]
MTQIKNAPNQPYLDTKGRWNWEAEDTLVDRSNRLPNRIRRFIRNGWWWKLIVLIVIIALFDANFMRSLIGFLGTAIPLAITLAVGLLQFVAIMWFVSRPRTYEVMPGSEGIDFKDYRGQPELLEQARQIVTLLRGVAAFEKSGGEPLTGLLLEGPPGTGKTWLAKAISTEAGVPFYYVDTSSLQGMFMGTGALKVMQLFGKARKAARRYGAAVIFLDEIDSVGSRGDVSQVGGRGGPMGGMGGMAGGMGGMGVLSTLLIQMDGFSQNNNWQARLKARFYRLVLRRSPPKPQRRVLVIGATNRIGALDPALLRPGRFDKKIRVDVPDMQGRIDMFTYYLSKMAHEDGLNPAILATETPGYTPADIKYLLNEALRYALFDGRTYITYNDFRLAQPEHEMGLRAPLKHISPEAKKRLAYHEAGHAVAVRLFMPHHRIARITIIRQGQAFGHVSHYPAREAYQGMQTKKQMLNRLKVAVAGKAAEIEFCGLENQTLGVAGDFMSIRNTLNRMALAGMLGTLGGAVGRAQDFMVTGSNSFASPTPEMAQAMEETFQNLLRETRETLRENRETVEALVQVLLDKEELLADEVRTFFDRYNLPTPDPTTFVDGVEVSLLPKPTEKALPGTTAAKMGD